MYNKGICWHLGFLGLLTCLCLVILLKCPSLAMAQEDPVILLQNFQDLPLPRAAVPLNNRHNPQLLLDLSDSGDVRIKYGKTSLTIVCNLDTPDEHHTQQPVLTTALHQESTTMPGINLMLTFAF